ncbi:MAG TPA: serine--tRNA ligase [Luteibaculaceae bacterium]|nr:serine--tRNA ligase [Luteibaculaceae bacterium]
MLELTAIREQRAELINRLSKRGLSVESTLNQIIQLDDERKSNQHIIDNTLAELNKLSKEIGKLMQGGDKAGAEALKQTVASLKESIKDTEARQEVVAGEIRQLLYTIPNAPVHEVPQGRSAADNHTVYENALPVTLPEGALPHWELAKKYDLIDFELGVKITGAGFPVYKGKGARLQRALIQYFLDQADQAGYTEIIPPLMVNEDSGIGTGQLPDKEGQMYYVGADDLYLIPTAEVPITNIYRDVILKEADFPIKLAGYTPCFRREAGSYGKDVRGLNRLHQFDKVEIVQIEHPQRSMQTLDHMVNHVKKLLDSLNLPYRVLLLCGGDMGFASAITYDLEVFSAAQEKWLEVSSVSNFEAFQANRLKLRFKDADGKTQLAHTLNGSALALPRILAALLENNQTPNGILVPEVLHSYTGFKTID